MPRDEESVGLMEALVLGKTYNDSSREGFWSSWGAKGINWCEPDYEHSHFVAETWNTLSNIAFIAAGVAGRRLAQRMKLPNRFYALSWSLIWLGLTSGAFHATLLWVNQKLDETFESVSLVALFHVDRASQALPLVHAALVAFGIFTITFFLFCELHLITIVLLTLWKVRAWVDKAQLVTKGKAGVSHAVSLAAASAGVGFACWLVDRLACAQLMTLAFNPQLHAWWHVLCGIALYEAFVLAAALYSLQQVLETQPEQLESMTLPLLQRSSFGLHYPSNIKLPNKQ